MNRKLLFALIVPVLTSCTPINNPSENETLDLGSTVKDFKNGIKVSVDLNETYNGNTTKLYLQNASKEKEFSFIQFKDETKTEKALHEYYTSKRGDSKNLVYSTRLNANNTYTYYEVYNPALGEYFTWDDGYNNAFLNLSINSFNKVDDLTYSLKEELLESESNEFSTLIYGNPGLKLDSLTISQNNENLILSGELSFSTTYSYTFEALVIEKGTSTKMDYRMTPFANVEGGQFNDMISTLKQYNFTTTVENYQNNTLIDTSIYYSEQDKVYWETSEYKSGYYNVGNGKIQEIQKIDDKYYKLDEPYKDSLNTFRPSFKLSAACFNENNNIYTLKEGVEGDMFSVTILESYAEDFSQLTIEIKEDSYVVTNIRKTLKTVATFTNIGSTTCPFNIDELL